MADKMEMSLDDIIKSNPQGRGGRGGVKYRGGGGFRGGSRGNFRGLGRYAESGTVQRGRGRGGISRSFSRGDVNSAWKHNFSGGDGPRKLFAARGPAKLMLSNLDFGVTNSDIQELFAEFGPLKSAAVHYDRSGRSLGTADIIFERRDDAVKALKQYNGVPLDGRAMNIQLFSPEMRGVEERQFQNVRPRVEKTRSSRGRGGERTQRISQRKLPTAEELDAELDAYNQERVL